MNDSKKNIKLAILYFLLTIALLAIIFKFGILGAVEISSLFQKNNISPDQSNLYENIIPPPQLFPPPEATNSAVLPISGYSLPNQKVEIFINDLNVKTIETDSEGKFESDLSLSLGISKVYLVAINTNEIKSPPSKSWTIFYNNSPPYLEILDPNNNSSIKGSPDIIIKGKISPPSKAYVNDHLMIIENERYFNYPAKLQSGENKFKIVCLDPAQNKTELEWIINYQP